MHLDPPEGLLLGPGRLPAAVELQECEQRDGLGEAILGPERVVEVQRLAALEQVADPADARCPGRVQAVVDWFGPADLLPWPRRRGAGLLWGSAAMLRRRASMRLITFSREGLMGPA